MAEYAEREDVLRVLGGTLDIIQTRFDLSLWDGAFPVTEVTVDGNAFDMPDTLLARIDRQVTDANSRVDGYILKAYRARPAPVPEHLRSATARLAAYHTMSTDGVRPDYVREDHKETLAYLKDLASGKFDLGIVSPRPRTRRPAFHVSLGVGGGSGGGSNSGRGRGGCC